MLEPFLAGTPVLLISTSFTESAEGGVLHRPGVLSPTACAALRRAVDAEQSMLADTVDRAPEHQLSFGRGAEAREAVERLVGHDEAARLWAAPPPRSTLEELDKGLKPPRRWAVQEELGERPKRVWT